MLLSKTTQYALRVLTHMASGSPGALHTADSLHLALDVPERYLRQLLTDLAKKGYITSIRGRSGGFRLAPKTPKTPVAEIIAALEGLEPMSGCALGFEQCMLEHPCSLHDIWADARRKLLESFANTTLEAARKPRRRTR